MILNEPPTPLAPTPINLELITGTGTDLVLWVSRCTFS